MSTIFGTDASNNLFCAYRSIHNLNGNLELFSAGQAYNIVGLAASEDKLWAANTSNELWVRNHSKTASDWKKIGHANNVAGLTYSGGKLWCFSGGQLWARDAVESNVEWRAAGVAPTNACALAACNGELFCATKDNHLLARAAALHESQWRAVGHANNVTALSGYGNTLYAASGGKIWIRASGHSEHNWTPLVDVPLPVTGLAVV